MTARKGRPVKGFRAAQSTQHHPNRSAPGRHWPDEWSVAVAALTEAERAPYDDPATYADVHQ